MSVSPSPPTVSPLAYWHLPAVKGRYKEGTLLKNLTWFRVGGPADILFKPESTEDLSTFLATKPQELNVHILGAGSNLLVRDAGIRDCVVKLGASFGVISFEGNTLIAGAAALDRTVVMECLSRGLSGLEFLVGVPGTIGGAVAMNAGAYGFEVKDFLLWAECLTPQGQIVRLTPDELTMSYRCGNIPNGWIITRAAFKLEQAPHEHIQTKVDEYLFMREASQPIRGRTGGSTFKNPLPHKAWELIDQAGCRGLQLGDAQIAEKHCNFMLNLGNATAAELEQLGETVRERVFAQTQTLLHWEIIRWGEKA